MERKKKQDIRPEDFTMLFSFFRRTIKPVEKCTKICPDCLHEMTDTVAEGMNHEPLLSRVSLDKQERLRKQLADAFAVESLFAGDEWDGRL
jgi:hypothetical protein